MIPLDHHAFEQRKARIISIVDQLGDVDAEDAGRHGQRRQMVVKVGAPDDGRPLEATFKYAEVYRLDGRRWRLVEYSYEYLDRTRGKRFAYHYHDLGRHRSVYHAHCVRAEGRTSVSHFRAYEVDLLEAHAIFEQSYVSGRPIDCFGLHSLRA